MTTNINDIQIFNEVVSNGSFTEAAKNLRLPVSAVSRRIARLEAHLDAQLLRRTTRKLSLTEAGRLYYERSHRIMAELNDAERAVTALQKMPRGMLRFTTPPDDEARIWSLVSSFLRLYPSVQMEWHQTYESIDLVKEGIDVALRGGPKPESTTYTAKKLLLSRWLLVASPHYLERRGTPQTPSDLSRHECIFLSAGGTPSTWTLTGPRGSEEVSVTGRLTTNNMATALHAAREGYGIAQVISMNAAIDLRAGALVEVLRGALPEESPMWLVYPRRGHISPAVRAFVDYLSERTSEFETA